MSDILHRIAAVHAERQKKSDEILKKKQLILGRKKAYFKDSGIPEMWEDVKAIKIKNPVPEILAGFYVPLADLLVEYNITVAEQSGLVLRDTSDSELVWRIEIDEKTNEPLYEHIGKNHKMTIANASEKDAKKNFVDSFVRYLSYKITPVTLEQLGVDIGAPAPDKKITRKFLQVAAPE